MLRRKIYFKIIAAIFALTIIGGCDQPVSAPLPDARPAVNEEPEEATEEEATEEEQPATETEPEPETEPETETITETEEQETMAETKKFTTFQNDFTFPTWLLGKDLWLSEIPATETEEAIPARRIATFAKDGITEPVEKQLYPNPITPDSFAGANEPKYFEETGPGKYVICMTGKFDYEGQVIFGEVYHLIEKTDTALTYKGRPAELRDPQ